MARAVASSVALHELPDHVRGPLGLPMSAYVPSPQWRSRRATMLYMGYLRGYFTPTTDQLVNYLTDRIIALFNRMNGILWSAPAVLKRIKARLIQQSNSCLR